ncbi:hypothetical protein DRJ12_04140 [Candidatus Acetothermia bacterium]|nr:MAG: hypothetical protein DRJ12_04140 [Candidatus Acetothermia bacterium]
MKKALILAVLVVGFLGVAGMAQCGCSQPPVPPPAPNSPTCYTAYWAGEEIHFKLHVPAEYFFTSPTPPTPLITGWRVEMLDGTVVYQDLFPDAAKGAWYEMVWNQRDMSCSLVPAGFYRIVVSTDSAGVYTAMVRIVPLPPCLAPCGFYPRLVSPSCTAPCGTPYIQFLPQERTTGISITITVPLNCGSCP